MWLAGWLALFAMDAPTASGSEGAAEPPVPVIVVLDFDGAEVQHVPDVPGDPELLTTPFVECAGPWPAFGSMSEAADLAARVQELFAPFGVTITTEMPACRPYVRVLVGPSTRCGQGVGYAESACDRLIADALVFAKIGADDHRSLQQRAVIVAHEIGHAFGLAHVAREDDVMHATVGDADKVFVDACSELASSGSGDTCPLSGGCTDGEAVGQNGHEGLLSMFGPSGRRPTADPCADAAGRCECRASSPHAALALFGVLLGVRRRYGVTVT